MPDSQPYEHTDGQGDTLRIHCPDIGDGVFIVVEDSRGRAVMHAAPGDLADITAALYAKAGLPAPIIPIRSNGGSDSISNMPALRVGDDGTVRAANTGLTALNTKPKSWTVEMVRQRAAELAAFADQAEAKQSEFDQAEVDRVAAVLHEAQANMIGNPSWPDQMARTVLRTHTVTPRKETHRAD